MVHGDCFAAEVLGCGIDHELTGFVVEIFVDPPRFALRPPIGNRRVVPTASVETLVEGGAVLKVDWCGDASDAIDLCGIGRGVEGVEEHCKVEDKGRNSTHGREDWQRVTVESYSKTKRAIKVKV